MGSHKSTERDRRCRPCICDIVKKKKLFSWFDIKRIIANQASPELEEWDILEYSREWTQLFLCWLLLWERILIEPTPLDWAIADLLNVKRGVRLMAQMISKTSWFILKLLGIRK